jgi:hypothetical protein
MQGALQTMFVLLYVHRYTGAPLHFSSYRHPNQAWVRLYFCLVHYAHRHTAYHVANMRHVLQRWTIDHPGVTVTEHVLHGQGLRFAKTQRSCATITVMCGTKQWVVGTYLMPK